MTNNMEKNFLKISENANPNYLALVTKIGKLEPIEGADKLVKTMVNGFNIVVGKNMHEGDIVIYVPVESALSEKYLSANNLYEIGNYQKNSNAPEVGVLIKKAEVLKLEGKNDESKECYAEAKNKTGYFNKNNRVRIVNLRGCPSNGYIADINTMVKYEPKLADADWENLVGTYFNFVGDDEFCKKYIPFIPGINDDRSHQKNHNKAMKKLERFDKLIPGQFAFHYDTTRIDATNFSKLIKPDDTIVIDVKCHGTSVVIANILIKKKLSLWEKIKKLFGFKVNETEYGNIYSSHKVIKNRYINNGEIHNFYDTDIWGCVNRDFAKYLPEGMTVYGEIVGYIEGQTKMIQKNHDYGCEPGKWKFMPYRITETDKFGNTKEYNVLDVDKWTRNLVKEHPELEEKVLYLNFLYHGKLYDLYPDIPVDENFYTNVLDRIHNDKNFYMELKEPMCHLYEKEANASKLALDKAIQDGESKKTIAKLQKEYDKYEALRAPREGVVIRIDNDPTAEAFKIKTNAHYGIECAQHDAGEVDIEEIS